MDVEEAVKELYGLVPEQFTASRDALVKAAKDSGNAPAAAALKALRRPTLAAWLGNQLVRSEPDRIHELTELGEQLREAHLSGDGSRVHELTPQRYRLIEDLVQAARTHAEEAGHPVNKPVTERLDETLNAALIDPGAAQLLEAAG